MDTDPLMHTCPCCGYRVGVTSYDICDVCGWENDPVQAADPDYPSGANPISLREGQRNFKAIGSSHPRRLEWSEGPDGFERDPDWRPADGT
jgi:hypothetical protein